MALLFSHARLITFINELIRRIVSICAYDR